MDKKRIIFIIFFLITTIGLGYALYRVFFAPPAPEEVEAPTTGVAEEFPEAGEPTGLPTAGEGLFPTVEPAPVTAAEQAALLEAGKARQTLSGNVADAAPVSGGAARFYSQTDGKFYKMNTDGSVKEFSDEVFYNVENVTWSPTSNESIIEYPDGSNIYYNFDTKEQVTLPSHWEEFSFSPSGDQLVSKSMALAPENRWLVTSGPNGENVQLVEPLGNKANKVIVDWSPGGQVIALSRTGETLGGERQEVLLVGQHGENFKSITVEGMGLETKWSPSGSKLLHSVYSARSDYKPELWIVNASGDAVGTGRKLLNVNTWAYKCAFSDDRFVYCAVPENLQRGSAFAPEMAENLPYDIYRIDTQTGARQQILVDDKIHVIDSVFVSDDGKSIHFTDTYNEGIFSLPL